MTGTQPHKVHLSHEDLERLRELRALKPARFVPKPEMTRGAALADWVAETVGSWRFIMIQSVVLAIWIALNMIAAINHWDPYPFILLNLVLSFQAAYAAPIIMMSQNRQSEIDRRHAEHDYRINVKAELEIELLHNKIDALREQEIVKLPTSSSGCPRTWRPSWSRRSRRRRRRRRGSDPAAWPQCAPYAGPLPFFCAEPPSRPPPQVGRAQRRPPRRWRGRSGGRRRLWRERPHPARRCAASHPPGHSPSKTGRNALMAWEGWHRSWGENVAYARLRGRPPFAPLRRAASALAVEVTAPARAARWTVHPGLGAEHAARRPGTLRSTSSGSQCNASPSPRNADLPPNRLSARAGKPLRLARRKGEAAPVGQLDMDPPGLAITAARRRGSLRNERSRAASP